MSTYAVVGDVELALDGDAWAGDTLAGLVEADHHYLAWLQYAHALNLAHLLRLLPHLVHEVFLDDWWLKRYLLINYLRWLDRQLRG